MWHDRSAMLKESCGAVACALGTSGTQVKAKIPAKASCSSWDAGGAPGSTWLQGVAVLQLHFAAGKPGLPAAMQVTVLAFALPVPQACNMLHEPVEMCIAF